MTRYCVIALLLFASSLQTVWAQNTVGSIRQRYAAAKEYARTHKGNNMYDGADFGVYYHLEARQWLPGTGGHVEDTYLYYDAVDVDTIVYDPHFLTFATTRFNYAAREYYREFLYDADGKVAFIYGYDPMTSFEGDENECQYEFRYYFSDGQLIHAIVKRKSYGEGEFREVYAGAALKPVYQPNLDELLTASRALHQLFIDIEKEAY